MSYSVCLNCHQVVSSYQKYCPTCEKTHQQSKEFWKQSGSHEMWSNSEKRAQEIEKDKKKEESK